MKEYLKSRTASQLLWQFDRPIRESVGGNVYNSLLEKVRELDNASPNIAELVRLTGEVIDRLDCYCGTGKYQGDPYEGEDCPHEFIGLDRVRALRAVLAKFPAPIVEEG